MICQIKAEKGEFLYKLVKGGVHYNNIKQASKKKSPEGMFYYTPFTTFEPNANLLYYLVPNGYGISLPQTTYCQLQQTVALTPTYTNTHNESSESLPCPQASPRLISLKTQVSQITEGSSESRTLGKLSVEPIRPTYKKCQKLGIQEIKLDFRIQWKNQNRNIVPNLLNQMMSFLLKKNKSQKLINKLFNYYPHCASWTPNKFYLYMKKIKESSSHYINESVIQFFFQVHDPNCQIYQLEEQQFYMKLCRIAIVTFLRDDAIIISLTSTRMSEAKRLTHLIAREALLRKFLELSHNRHF